MFTKNLSKRFAKVVALSVVISILAVTYAPIPLQAQSTSVGETQAWDSNKIYLGGDQVSYNGELFEAKWWTQNETPDASNQWGVWKFIGEDTNPIEPEQPEEPEKPEKPVEPEEPEEPEVPEFPQDDGEVEFEVTADWGSGFNYAITIKNNDSKPLEDWKLEFDYSGKITNAWDVVLTRSGNHYTVTPNSWNRDIPANGILSFGGGGTEVGQISNIRLSGSSLVMPGDPEGPSIEEPEPGKPLTDEQIQVLWNGIDPKFSAENAAGKLEELLSKEEFEELFPYRHGSKLYNEYNNSNVPEYYTYDGLREAVKQVANVKYKIETRGDAAWNTRVWRLDKTTKEQMLVSDSVDFDSDWNKDKPVTTQIVDFGSFLSEGTIEQRKKEIAAFLANVAHETGGGWATAPGGEFAWGLYYKEEVNHSDETKGGYTEPNEQFPPYGDKSYHGRGPIQLSYNYNYGLMSAILYGDKNILLQNPEMVSHDPVVGFATAISFWMAPQGNKPSCHEVMAGTWVPTQAQIDKGCSEPCFGVTIIIINGGLESGRGEEDGRIRRRAGHYRMITSKMGVDITGEQLDTIGMKPL